jgi:hypothetical protein
MKNAKYEMKNARRILLISSSHHLLTSVPQLSASYFTAAQHHASQLLGVLGSAGDVARRIPDPQCAQHAKRDEPIAAEFLIEGPQGRPRINTIGQPQPKCDQNAASKPDQCSYGRSPSRTKTQ